MTHAPGTSPKSMISIPQLVFDFGLVLLFVLLRDLLVPPGRTLIDCLSPAAGIALYAAVSFLLGFYLGGIYTSYRNHYSPGRFSLIRTLLIPGYLLFFSHLWIGMPVYCRVAGLALADPGSVLDTAGLLCAGLFLTISGAVTSMRKKNGEMVFDALLLAPLGFLAWLFTLCFRLAVYDGRWHIGVPLFLAATALYGLCGGLLPQWLDGHPRMKLAIQHSLERGWAGDWLLPSLSLVALLVWQEAFMAGFARAAATSLTAGLFLAIAVLAAIVPVRILLAFAPPYPAEARIRALHIAVNLIVLAVYLASLHHTMAGLLAGSGR